MKILRLIVASCLSGLVACSAGGAGGADDAPVSSLGQTKTLPDDSVIIGKSYDNDYQVPESFYVDERASTPRSYSLYHVKDVSVSYERCTDDYDEALAWEATDNEDRSVGGYYVGSIETDKYFEVIRELSYTDGVGNIDSVTSPGFSRVFKCDYVNRNGVDRNLRDGYAGTLSVNALTTDKIRDFSEYMWQFTFFWPAKKLVLDTFSEEQASAYQHTLVLAFLTSQGPDKCDLIEVVDWIFTVSKVDGTITKAFQLLRKIETRLVDGTPELCGK